MSADSGQGIDKGGLTIPAADVSGHDLQHGNGRVCTEKGKRGALATGIVQEDPKENAMQQWEYKVLTEKPTFTQESRLLTPSPLNQLGQQGWELVAAFPVASVEGVTREIRYVLKRPK